MKNLTIVIPFWNGFDTINALLNTLPDDLKIIIVDDHSDKQLRKGDLSKENVRIVRPPEKGFFSGAVNEGLKYGYNDVLILNQDLQFTSPDWLGRLNQLRSQYDLIGDGVMGHPAWPKGYIQGTFMYISRAVIDKIGGFNVDEYPLWGSTCLYQVQACRAGFKAYPSKEWNKWIVHDGRVGNQKRVGRRKKFGSAIEEAIKRQPDKRSLFLRTPPAVSVIMPCFNYGRYLKDAVNSLIGGPTSLGTWPPQTFQSFEIIIVDDASSDNSWDFAQELVSRWKGIRAIRLPENRGTPGAINAGIAKSFGEYIHILSADDMREPNGLEVLYQGCRDNPKSVTYGNIRIFSHGERKRWLKLPDYSFDLVLHKNPMPAGIMYPKKAWKAVGGYPEEMKFGREDWAFNIRLGAAGYCGYHIGDSGNLYRREGQNRSLRTGNRHKGEPDQKPFNWRKLFMDQLKALYPDLYAGVRPMGCCGGRSSKKATVSKTSNISLSSAQLRSVPQGRVLLEYVGGNSGKTPWYVENRRYVFGGVGPSKVQSVLADDADELLKIRLNGRPQFRRYKMPKKLPKVPVEKQLEANPIVPDDFTRINKIGIATERKLKDAGFTTFRELSRQNPEDLAHSVGITTKTAKIAVLGAKEYV